MNRLPKLASLDCVRGIGVHRLFVESLMADDRTARINKAVDECLDRCSKSSTPPYITIQGFCQELRDSGWSEDDIKIVEETVTRIIAGIDSGQ